MDICKKREWVLLSIEMYSYDLKEPTYCCNKELFKQRSFSIWAVNELHRFVEERDYMDPVDAVVLFSKMMDDYSTYNKEGLRFSVAYDVAMNVMDILIAEF